MIRCACHESPDGPLRRFFLAVENERIARRVHRCVIDRAAKLRKLRITTGGVAGGDVRTAGGAKLRKLRNVAHRCGSAVRALMGRRSRHGER
jgi:hypothetical protein